MFLRSKKWKIYKMFNIMYSENKKKNNDVKLNYE